MKIFENRFSTVKTKGLVLDIGLVGATLLALMLLAGCSAGIFEQLAKDGASACGYSTITYGGFAIMPTPAVPGVGVQVHQKFCRSNTPGSAVTITPDGSMTIVHGVGQGGEPAPAPTTGTPGTLIDRPM